MQNDYTDVTVVLDNSSAMSCRLEETLAGFNKLLEDQRKTPGKLNMTVLKFAGPGQQEYIVKNADVNTVRDFTKEVYNADGGWTALQDALAKAINETGTRLRNMNEKDRPSKVLFVVITDGEENSSIEFGGLIGKKKVNEMVKHQKDKYNWDFTFIGADLSEKAAYDSYGDLATLNNVMVGNNKTYKGYAVTSGKLSSYRGLNANSFDSVDAFNIAKDASLSYTDEEKAELKS